MKYLKEYNHEFYFEISQDEYEDLNGWAVESGVRSNNKYYIILSDYDNILSFAKKINSNIKPVIQSYNIVKLPTPNGKELQGYLGITLLIDNKRSLFISLSKDEWYMCAIEDYDGILETEEAFYKCDQLEGLLKFLKDKL